MAYVIYHHGILGQKWGDRNGPPYPLGGGAYSKTEQKEIYKERRKKNSIYNKKHFDTVLSKDKTVLTTLSYDKNRTKDTDMFYAAHTKADKHQYNALFNRKAPIPVYNEKGEQIGTNQMYKFKINNKIAQDMKVASEDSGAKIFRDLYSKDRDFYNFVTDPARMESHFVKDKYKFKGYREAKHVLDKFEDPDYVPRDKDVQTIYRMFNYVIPSDGGGDARRAKDVTTQRTKFFNALKDAGYGAVLDTNDAIYGGFKTTSPVIVFDMPKVIPDSIKNTSATDKKISDLALVGRKLLGV